jgi:ParB family chromosome partitioning protein
VSALRTVRLDAIVAGDNDRQTFRDDELDKLAKSIREIGLVQPPTVRESGIRNAVSRYELVAGERRVRACRLAGLVEIEAFVRPLDDDAAQAVMLAENVGRVDLDPIEEGAAYRKRLDAGVSREQLADAVGVSMATIDRRTALLDLAPEIRALVSAGTLTVGFADMLRGLDTNRQVLAAQAILSGGLDWYSARRACDKLAAEQNADGMFDASAFLVAELIDDARKAKRVGRSELLGLLEAFVVGDADHTHRNRVRAILAAERVGAAA